MARKGGNPDIKKHQFKKGFDAKRNLKGAPKKLPKLKALMEAMLGGKESDDITDTPIAKIIDALIDETTRKAKGNQRVAAAKELLDRAFGKVKSEDENLAPPIQWHETKTYSSKDKNK